ncbi:taurine catabolism dioxygenase TauD [Streptomyces sp. IMTB 2501]|uniref:guanitoxin biosynthesis L-enduracididine beta-hydroxylase GntD n=1 Tax=Streptomyces sp. IMTB 2501 TaxID=1776340 RepID=UPI00096EB966|nr:guanitoxin biosynthesis L-enduracididine beta-hydroxylase GntD [Streptomyces sp. IMTB 2501]OLZ67267.1 taurine catabolism dioxygenase TauD [Streptomyces sp. IMTB 2501]
MPRLDIPVEYSLGGDEAAALMESVERLRDSGGDPADPEFYDRFWDSGHQLPPGLRSFLDGFRRSERSACALVHGFPVDETAIGPTPSHWEAAIGAKSTRDQEIFVALCGMALGEPFAWATLQSGRIIQNLLPIQGDEECQSGYGSEALLEFHTEDGFHPDRCDYLLLFGLRNDDQVPTIMASVRDLELSDEDRRILAEPRFYILPDDEHLRQLEARDPNHRALAKMRRMQQQPEATAVLFGDRLNPYLRIDRPFMRIAGEDGAAEQALDRLMAGLESVQQDVVVGPGTLLVLDNYLAVHGRRAFRARYDGTDRWLKRLTVTRNLRRGLVSRESDSHRVLL